MPLHSHRAPATPLSERGRTVVVTAALIGVGVAGATGDAALSHPRSDAGATRSAGPPVIPAAATRPATSPQQAAQQLATQQLATQQLAAQQQIQQQAAQQADGPIEAAYRPRHRATTTGRSAAPAYAAARQRVRPAPPQWVNPLPEATVTSCFGQRWGRLHAGVDLAAPDGTRIRAAGAGTVVAAGEESGYGNAVLIDHGNGYLTHYGHMSAITVRAGQRVAAGAPIGNEGSTGHSTGPHLHFEVHQGGYKNPIEPTRWMHERGVDIAGCAPTTAG